MGKLHILMIASFLLSFYSTIYNTALGEEWKQCRIDNDCLPGFKCIEGYCLSPTEFRCEGNLLYYGSYQLGSCPYCCTNIGACGGLSACCKGSEGDCRVSLLPPFSPPTTTIRPTTTTIRPTTTTQPTVPPYSNYSQCVNITYCREIGGACLRLCGEEKCECITVNVTTCKNGTVCMEVGMCQFLGGKCTDICRVGGRFEEEACCCEIPKPPPTTTTVQTTTTTICRGRGMMCESNADCCPGLRCIIGLDRVGRCSPCKGDWAPCQSNDECCEGLRCIRFGLQREIAFGRCVSPNEFKCDGNKLYYRGQLYANCQYCCENKEACGNASACCVRSEQECKRPEVSERPGKPPVWQPTGKPAKPILNCSLKLGEDSFCEAYGLEYECKIGLWIVTNREGRPLRSPIITSKMEVLEDRYVLKIDPSLITSSGSVRVTFICFVPTIGITGKVFPVE